MGTQLTTRELRPLVSDSLRLTSTEMPFEQTIQEQSPEDFQTAEYLLHHGLLDLIVPRSFLKQALSETITLYKDAPFKRSGQVPHGIQQPLNFINEENIRRRWSDWCNLSLFSSDTILENVKPLNFTRKINLNPNNENLGYKNAISYRQLLTSFQNMFDFLQNRALNTTAETTCFPVFNELKPLNKTDRFSSFDNPNLIIENFFNTSILLSIDKVIQWRTITNSKTILSKTTFLDNLANRKDKNFLYSTISKIN